MRQTWCKRLTAALLALFLGVGCMKGAAFPVFGVESSATIEIATPHDLIQLAKDCTLDVWSKDKTVLLTASIDLTAVSFSPIPSFSGTFQGNGHVIKGLNLTGNGFRQGLFRVVENGAVVQNLTVEGNVSPGGSQTSLGLLAGENFGTLQNCTVVGTVSGETDIGGLVGVNSGTIDQCTTNVTVKGQENTGGAAGRNTGMIVNTINRGAINNEPEDSSRTDPLMNMGGLAGKTEGAISNCTNYGFVGYPHTGYNVGGIAGVHSGALSGCLNHGTVQGRRGVGGIVGRFLPETGFLYGEDPMDKLNDSLIALSGLLKTLSGQMYDTVNDATEDISDISDNLSAIRESTSSGLQQGEQITQAALDEVHERTDSIGATVDGIDDRYHLFIDDTGTMLDAVSDTISALRAAVSDMAETVDEGLDQITDDLDGYTSDMSGSLSEVRDSIDDLGHEIERVQTFIQEVDRILNRGGSPSEKVAALEKAIDKIRGLDLSTPLVEMGTALEDIGAVLEEMTKRIHEIYEDSSSDIREHYDNLSDALEDLRNLLTGDSKSLRSSYSSFQSEVSGPVQEIDNTVEEIQSLAGNEILNKIYETVDSLKQAAGHVNDRYRGIIGDIEDFFNTVKRSMETIRTSIDGIAKATDGGLGDLTEALETYTSQINDGMGTAGAALDDLASSVARLQEFAKDVDAVINRGGSPSDKIADLENAYDGVRGLDVITPLTQAGAAIDAIGQTIAQMAQSLNDTADQISSDLQTSWDDVQKDMDQLSDHGKTARRIFHEFSDNISGQLKKVRTDLDGLQSVLRDWGSAMDVVGNGTLDNIDGYLDALSSTVDAMTEGAQDYNRSIRTTLDSIIDQMDEVRVAANGLTEEPEHTLDDRSDEEVEESGANGLILSSNNDGEIHGDMNVGGIAGIVSVEISDDPEEDWNWEDEKYESVLSDVTTIVRAAVRTCYNFGLITAKNEGAGGIVGRADLGAVLDCLNMGDVTVEDGSYCGGVAGLSKNVIRRSYALCTLTGNGSVGGIVGQGTDVTDCRSMVSIEADGEKVGTIAGWADGEIWGNYTVQEGLGALDGIDRSGQAEGLAYEKFAQIPNLPLEFLQFVLTFRAEGKVIKEIGFSYGGAIDRGEIPEVPQKEGYYATWENFSTSGLVRSRVIEAVYTPWTTTISSGGAKPVLLAEGNFSPSAVIVLEEWVPEEIPGNMTLVGSWKYKITDPERLEQPENCRIHVLAEEAGSKAKAGLLQEDGTLQILEGAVLDGRYLVLEAPAQGSVVVLEANGWSSGTILILAGGGILLFLFLLRKRRKKRKDKKRKKLAAQASQTEAVPETASLEGGGKEPDSSNLQESSRQ